MATNNAGHLLDSEGKVFVDFVWGNMPLQPNDDRADGTPTITETVGGDQNVQWTHYSTIDSARLDPDLDSHSIAISGWSGYPAFVANSAGEGIAYVNVPSVIGLTTASATDAMEDASLVVTVASGATNTAKTVTAVSRTSGSATATITATGAGAAYPVGTKITISSLTSGNAELNGTWTVTAVATDTVSFVSSATTALSGSSLTGSVVGVSGTIKTQSIAAGANTISPAAAVTITPYA